MPTRRELANAVRALSMDAVQQANSGHPGMPMGDAAMAYTLWTRFLKHNPKNPFWHNRDRFILSAGHGSMLLYSLLHLTGHAISLDDIKNIYDDLGRFVPFAQSLETHTGVNLQWLEDNWYDLMEAYLNG